MKGIKGQLSSLSITDLLQWIDMNKKSGILFVSSDRSNKCFCFENGRLLMAAAKEQQHRFGDFLSQETQVPIEMIQGAIKDSQSKGISFITYLVEQKLVPAEFIKVTIEQLAENIILDILDWDEGSFQFVEDLPVLLSKSPVQLGINFITFEAVRKHDEVTKRRSG